MFSGIRDLLRITRISKDPQMLPPQHRKTQEDSSAPGDDDGLFGDDDTLFSIEAIRAMLTADPLPPELAETLGPEEKDRILQALHELEVQGIHNIPIRLNQSILEAVRAALPHL